MKLTNSLKFFIFPFFLFFLIAGPWHVTDLNAETRNNFENLIGKDDALLFTAPDGKIIFSSKKDEILENYAIVKGGNDLLNPETRRYFKGVRTGEFGFEALTDNADEARKTFGSDVIIDKASLEDIMYFSNLRGKCA